LKCKADAVADFVCVCVCEWRGELTWVFEVGMVSEGFEHFTSKERGFWILDFWSDELVQVDVNSIWSD
jgi:hypothetical protein